MNAREQVRSLTAKVPPDVRPNGPERRAGILNRLSDVLSWPAWRSDRDAPPLPGNSPGDEPASALVERALERAGPAAEGGAYTAVLEDEARATADLLVRIEDRRPLAGVPFAAKDLIAVAGQPLRAGSSAREDAPAEPIDAQIVGRLRAAGAVLIGLTTLHEFGFGVTGINEHAGTARNPVDARRVPGGSSSGSAVAVASGSVPFALGTDTGGSVRIPAALCGVVGFKPSFATYPADGVFPLAPSLDHVGLLACDVATVARVHRALGYVVGDAQLPRRVGVVEADLEAAQPHVAERIAAVVRRLERHGAAVVILPWPVGDVVLAVSTAIMFSEAAAVHRDALLAQPGRYGSDVRARLSEGLEISAATYVSALRARDDLRLRVRGMLDEVDCVVGPTVGRAAPRLEQAQAPEVSADLIRNTRLANVAGVAVMSLPVPGNGLPVGLQVTAASDPRLIGLALQLERSLSA